MGRHRRSTESVSAANYVGRVGALALALGIGAFVAGGAGVARADGATDSSAASAQPSSDSHADGSTGATASASGSSTVPKIELGGSNGKQAASADPDSSTGVIASVPHRITTLVADGTTGDSRPSSSPSRERPKPQSHAAISTAPDPSQPTEVGKDTTTARHAAAEPSVETAYAPPTTTTAAVAPVQARLPHDAPVTPIPVGLAVLQLIRRDVEDIVLTAAAVTGTTPNAVAAVATPALPSPTDVAHTPYGDVGQWLLQANGQIANYGGVPHDGKTVLEPINVIILDPSSTSTAQSAAKLNAAMNCAGFPAQPIHSTGFLGTIDGTTYGQQPSGFLQAFSDSFFLFTNDHGRMFGPAPASNGTGYVWTGAFSTEELNPSNPLTHEYVSSDLARAELIRRLVASGRATVVGVVPLGNAYDDGTLTTGDHDGYAVVLQLTPVAVILLPTGGLLGAACGHVNDIPGPVVRQVAMDVCVVAASISNALGLRSIV